jgi:hypothetical protein
MQLGHAMVQIVDGWMSGCKLSSCTYDVHHPKWEWHVEQGSSNCLCIIHTYLTWHLPTTIGRYLLDQASQTWQLMYEYSVSTAVVVEEEEERTVGMRRGEGKGVQGVRASTCAR